MKRSSPVILLFFFVFLIFICSTSYSDTSSTSSKAETKPVEDKSTSTKTTSEDSSNTKETVSKSELASSSALTSSSSGSGGTASSNVQAASVQVEPFSGSANLSIPIAVPPGRAGIQPSLALVYSSASRGVGLAGVGWTVEMGSIQRSTKKGVPQYDSTDTFVLMQGGSQELIYDTNAGFYRTEVEGGFSRIEKQDAGWVIIDKKGMKYYFGNTDDSRQYDPNNLSKVFRWALNRVEDLSGNYMTISYTRDANQIYPEKIDYTGNSKQSLGPYAQVKINYAYVTQPSVSYMTGFKIKTAERIANINVSVNSISQTKYTFTYKQSADTQRDLLQSVVQSGSDGSQLPAVTFTYNEGNPKFQLSSGWSIPTDLALNYSYNGQMVDSGLRIADLNGDGYPDFIRSFFIAGISSSQNTYTYLNNKDNGWTISSSWAVDPNSSPFSYIVNMGSTPRLYAGALMSDLNGDGLADLIGSGEVVSSSGQSVCWGWGYFVNNGNGAFSRDTSWSMPSGVSFYRQTMDAVCRYDCPQTSNGVVLGDVNGDGFPDLIQSTAGKQGAYINQLPQGSKSFNLKSTLSLPGGSYTDFTQGAISIDLNGDGLDDIFYRKDGVSHVFMNTGNGWVEDAASGWDGYPQYGNLIDRSTQMVDVDGNGLVDMVITAQGDTANAKILLNTGNGWILYNSSIGEVNFFDSGTQFLDANADGMIDYFSYQAGGSPKLYLNQGKPADLLVGVNNGIGTQTAIEYDSALHYQNIFLPFTLFLVKSSIVTVANPVGSASVYTTRYNYSGGLWDKDYREFNGFKTVKVIDVDGNYTQTIFAQDHYMRGHPLEQSTYDKDGRLYSKTVNQWTTQDVVSSVIANEVKQSKFVYLARSDNYFYDGTSAAKRTAQEMTYGESPQYGDLTQIINYGEVDSNTGADIGTDKIITQNEFIYNTSNWLLGLPKYSMARDFNGNAISQAWFYYDDVGHLTKKINWLGDSKLADPQTLYTYDVYGNLKTTTDALGRTTTVTYDNDVHMFPVQTINVLNQSSTNIYYGVGGVALDNGLWGQVKSSTDANNQTALMVYDSFGRQIASIGPLDTLAKPSGQSIYELASNYTKITTKARIDNGADQTIDSVSYYDGLGRLIESKSLGPNAGQYIVSSQTEYNNRGLPVKQYRPRFTTNDLNTLDPIDSTQPTTQTQYDAMGRIIKSINPDGTYSNVVYDRFTTTTYDANGHMQKSYSDAFGRLIQKEEYTGADGRASDYPATSYKLYATTSYSYDAKGNLISVMDAKGNVTAIKYDNLNRKTAMDDPDMGHWEYSYDLLGNLISQKDAKNQTVRFSYDALNRLLNKTDGIPSGPINNFPDLPATIPTFNVVYNYDSTNQDYGKGRLGSVFYDNGTASFSYDQLGRETVSNKKIDSRNYNVNRQYDALNRLKQIKYPDALEVKYTYNQAGQINGVEDYSGVMMPMKVAHNQDKISFGMDEAWAANSNSSSKPTISLAASVNHSSSTAPADITLVANAASSASSIAKVDFYNGRTLLATLTSEPYVYVAKTLKAGKYSFTAKITDKAKLTATSKAVRITVKAHLTPTVSLTSPLNKAAYTGPANIAFAANATAHNAAISKVDFYQGKILLGTSISAPHEFHWNNAIPGSYSLTAIATDSYGGVSTSASVAVTVNQPLPQVNMASPGNNAYFLANQDILLSANATAFYGTISKVEFYNGTKLLGSASKEPFTYTWKKVAVGNYKITAKAINNGATAISSAVAVNVTQTHLAPTINLDSPAANASNVAPVSLVLSATPTVYGGQVSKVEFFNGSTLIATVNASPYSYLWDNIVPGSYALKAVVTDSNSASGASSVVNVTVQYPYPTVSLTSPLANATYTVPSDIVLSAQASSSFGDITKVEFYNGPTLLSTLINSPYTFTWPNVPIGNYSLTAKAYNADNVSTSTVVNVIVNPHMGPSIKLSEPLTGGSLTAPTNVTLQAQASAVNATVSKVEFFNGEQSLGIVSSSPYIYMINDLAPGIYRLTAKATDSVGASTMSEAVNITILQPSPKVAMTLPDNNAIFNYPTDIVLKADVLASYGSIGKVEFYNGTELLATATISPYTVSLPKPAVGIYTIKAVAYNNGVQASSTPMTFTVNAHIAPTVNMVTPANNASYKTRENLSITADAFASDCNISKVEFYNGDVLLGSSTSSPYSFTWPNLTEGEYSLTAKAYDEMGAVTVSAAARISVYVPPEVSLISPEEGSVFLTASNITLAANASVLKGSITNVEFYNGSTLLGAATQSPYVFVWKNVDAGQHHITAKAYDDKGHYAISSQATVSVSTPSNYVKSVNYNASGQMTQIQYGNGTITAYTYDPLSLLLKRIYTSNGQGQALQDLSYGYDALGQIAKITDAVNTATQGFKYDELNRLIYAQGSYGTKTYAYDEIGNILQKDGLTYSYGELNGRTDGSKAGPHAVTSLSDGSIFKYDANGNMAILSKGSETTTYTYDPQNRLTVVNSQTFGQAPVKVSEYFYDGDGGRVKKIVYRRDKAIFNSSQGYTSLLFKDYNGKPWPGTASNTKTIVTRYVGQLYEEESPGTDGALRKTKFIYLGSTRVAAVSGVIASPQGEAISYYHTDHLGGTNVISDKAGLARELTEYDPFGLIVKHDKYGDDLAQVWYGFTGKVLDDETGLMYYGARYYNPTLGRFITPDSIVPVPDNLQTFNRYTYCNNNPVILIDRNGHAADIPELIAGGFTGFITGAISGAHRSGIVGAISGGIGGMIAGLIVTAGSYYNPFTVGAAGGAVGNLVGNSLNIYFSHQAATFGNLTDGFIYATFSNSLINAGGVSFGGALVRQGVERSAASLGNQFFSTSMSFSVDQVYNSIFPNGDPVSNSFSNLLNNYSGVLVSPVSGLNMSQKPSNLVGGYSVSNSPVASGSSSVSKDAIVSSSFKTPASFGNSIGYGKDSGFDWLFRHNSTIGYSSNGTYSSSPNFGYFSNGTYSSSPNFGYYYDGTYSSGPINYYYGDGVLSSNYFSGSSFTGGGFSL